MVLCYDFWYLFFAFQCLSMLFRCFSMFVKGFAMLSDTLSSLFNLFYSFSILSFVHAFQWFVNAFQCFQMLFHSFSKLFYAFLCFFKVLYKSRQKYKKWLFWRWQPVQVVRSHSLLPHLSPPSWPLSAPWMKNRSVGLAVIPSRPPVLTEAPMIGSVVWLFGQGLVPWAGKVTAVLTRQN